MIPRLLLVAPPVLHGEGWWSNRDAGKAHLEVLAAHVADRCAVSILELDRGDGLDEALARFEAALEAGVDLVGISCWTSLHYLGARALVTHLRRERPGTGIVVGGHHATALPEDFVDLADWVVVGDGEQALRGLLAGGTPARPAGTIVLRGEPLDLAGPDPVDWGRYGGTGAEDTVWMALSRGCPFRCRFCLEPLRAGGGSRMPVERALAAVEAVVRARGPRVVAFADPLFGSNRAWTEGFLEGLRDRALPTTFWAETRADLMTPALLEGFLAARFKLDFGLDTGSATMAAAMEKAARPELYLERSAAMLRRADALGLPHGLYLLFNYPGETPETTAETRAWVRALLPPGGACSGLISAQSFFFLPGTESYRRRAEYAERYGAAVRWPDWWRRPGDHHAMATATIPHRAWRGRERELRAFASWQRGENARWTARWSEPVRAFHQAFYGAG